MKFVKALLSGLLFIVAVTLAIAFSYFVLFWIVLQLPRVLLSSLLLVLATGLLGFVAWRGLKYFRHYSEAKKSARARVDNVNALLGEQNQQDLIKQILQDATYSYGHSQGDSVYMIAYKGTIIHAEPSPESCEFWILERYLAEKHNLVPSKGIYETESL